MGVFECLRAVKSYNLTLQQTFYQNAIVYKLIFTFREIEREFVCNEACERLLYSCLLLYMFKISHIKKFLKNSLLTEDFS